jgi:DNA-binding CsgD family transcriptional regulator
MVNKNRSLTYWRIIAVIAAFAWMLVLVYNLRIPLSSYEKTAEDLFHPYVALSLEGVAVIGCVALVIVPLQFSIYAALCCVWGLFHIINGGSFGGILMYGLGLLFALKIGLFHAHRPIKLSFAILLLAGALFSQIRFGSEYLAETLLDALAVCVMAMLGVLLYSREIQKQASARETGMVMSEGQKKILLLQQGMFSQRDIDILQLILEGQRYEYIAGEQKISLSLVKKRVRFLYDHLNLLDRASFMSVYEGYSVELGVPVPKSEPVSNIRQFPAPQNSDAP